MEVGTTMAPSIVSVNRDGLTPVRLVQCMVSGPTDLRTVQLAAAADVNPVVGTKLLIMEIEPAWEVGFQLEDILAAVTTLIGDKVFAAMTAPGVASPLSQIALRAVPNPLGGQIELGGAADYVVAFNDMKIAFDLLKAQFNVHTHSYIPGALAAVNTAPPLPQATADMTPAMVVNVTVP